MNVDQATDRQAIRQAVEDWVIYRDSADWERLRSVWHADGYMLATWYQGTADEFIAMSQASFAKGVRVLHFLGAHTAEIQGDRAIAQTKMTISQRAEVEGVICDVVCTGRFYDFFAKRDGRWGLVQRQPIYEKDRLDPVSPSAILKLDSGLLAQFPEGYRHLAYLQSRIGMTVKQDMPGLTGPAVEQLYESGLAWLGKGIHPRLKEAEQAPPTSQLPWPFNSTGSSRGQ